VADRGEAKVGEDGMTRLDIIREMLLRSDAKCDEEDRAAAGESSPTPESAARSSPVARRCKTSKRPAERTPNRAA
jgi:hypothetical protein